MEDRLIRRERAHNIWSSFTRKFDALDRATQLDPLPEVGLDQVGGLASAKEEIQTYASAATSPDVYEGWGTFPPSGLLLIGQYGVGKSLLARTLASLTDTAFLAINVPQLVIEVVHRGGNMGELMQGWSEVLNEVPPITIFFQELEFSQAQEIGARRTDLPVGPVMDFLLDLLDRAIASEQTLVVGSTSHPDTLRQAFVKPARFERVVEVNPRHPDDIVAALGIHAANAEKRAGRVLFDGIDWPKVVQRVRVPSTGDWIHIMHSVLRRKARCEAVGETISNVTNQDLTDEVDRFVKASERIAVPRSGNYV